MKNIYEEKFRLRASDFDKYDRITPLALLDLAQDVAGKHASEFHVGYEDFKKNDCIWVLLRTRYEMYANPEFHAFLNVKTWPRKRGRIDFDRDTLITNETGDIVCKMQSKWAIVDMKKRTLVLPRNYEYPFGDCLDESTFDTPFDRLEDFDISSLEGHKVDIQYLDIDHNRHVNNVNYVKYALNLIKLEESMKISYLEINYVHELHEDDSLIIYYKKIDNVYYFKAVNEKNNIFLLKIVVESK